MKPVFRTFACFLHGCGHYPNSRVALVEHLTEVHGWTFKISKPDQLFFDYDSVLRYCQDTRVCKHDDCYYSTRSPLDANGHYRSHNLVCSYHASKADQEAATKQWEERLARNSPSATGVSGSVPKDEKLNQVVYVLFGRTRSCMHLFCLGH